MWDDLAQQIDLSALTVEKALATLGLLLLIVLLARLARRLVPRYLEEPARRYRVSKIISRSATVVAVIAIIAIWSPGAGDFVTVLTVVGAGLAIAMREVVLSFFGWVHVAFRSPFRTGDRIEINGLRGDVIDVRVLHTTLMEIGGWVDADQSTGRIVHLPNSWVYQHPVYNYTNGFKFIWNEVPMTVTFRSDWEAAREIMLSLSEVSSEIVAKQAQAEIRSMAREYLVHYSILTPFVYVKIVENGVQLTLRYLCEARKRRGTEHALTMGILNGFKEHGGIELAYPAVGIAQLPSPQFAMPPPTTKPSAKRSRSTPPDETAFGDSPPT